MEDISIVNGIINQLITEGAPSCMDMVDLGIRGYFGIVPLSALKLLSISSLKALFG